MIKALLAVSGILLCIPMQVLAQAIETDTLQLEKDSKGRITYASFKSRNGERKFSKGPEFLRVALKAPKNHEFRLNKQKIDDLGNNHWTYDQYYQGLRVEGANFILHGKSDDVESMNGQFELIVLNENKPNLNETSALKLALAYVNASKYIWEDPQWEDSVKSQSSDKKGTYYPKGELVIVKGTMNPKHEWRISWRFQITALQPTSIQDIWVDAVSGDVVRAESKVNHSNTSGTAQTLYSGTRSIVGDSFAFGYRLKELRNGVDIQTLNLVHGDINYIGNAVDFVDNDNNWTASEHQNDQDQAALDAHWGSEMVFDYWRTVHNRNSLDGNGIRIRNYIHWGYDVFNAAWYQAPYNLMVFGDGIGNPVVALDVMAHEMGHGIAQFEANLGATHEPGAINEGLSDIWAAVIENWAAPEKQKWIIGEDLGVQVRVLNNPNSIGYPDTYLGQYWQDITNCTNPVQGNDWCGVHYNSSVLSYWFYLLTEGGSGTNDNGSCYNVSGIAMSTAARIVYQAESYYVSASTNYPGIRNAMVQAAIDLYGSQSQYVSSVKNAWYAVGIGAASNTTGDIAGDVVCFAGTTITLNNSTANVTWVVSPSNLFVTSSGTGNAAYLQAATGKVSGPATITFTPTSGCGVSSNAVSKSIWVGKPQNNFSGPTSVYPDQIYTYSASDPNAFNWVWSLSPGVGDCGVTYGGNCFFGSGGGGQNFTIVWMHESGYVRLNASNACGAGPQRSVYVTVTTQGGCNPCQLNLVSPNPSSSELNVKLKTKEGEDIEPIELTLINSQQITVYTAIVSKTDHKIPTVDLPEGVYYLKASNSLGTETKRIVIRRGP